MIDRDGTALVLVRSGFLSWFLLWFLILSAPFAWAADRGGIEEINPMYKMFQITRACVANDFTDLLRHGGLVPCLQMKTATVIGHLCVTFQTFCLDRPWGEWFHQFLQNQKDLSDVLLNESGLSLLGQSNGQSWRIQSWPPGDLQTPSALMASHIRQYHEALQEPIDLSDWLHDFDEAMVQSFDADVDWTEPPLEEMNRSEEESASVLNNLIHRVWPSFDE